MALQQTCLCSKSQHFSIFRFTVHRTHQLALGNTVITVKLVGSFTCPLWMSAVLCSLFSTYWALNHSRGGLHLITFNLMTIGKIRCSSSVQSLSRVQLFATPCTAACQASLSITNSWSPPKHVHLVSDAIQSSHPLSSPSPSLNLSQYQGLFKWVSSSIRWPKYWSFSFNISPSSELYIAHFKSVFSTAFFNNTNLIW